MPYDSTKLIAAIESWLTERCKVGYGQVYSGALQADFENYCAKTGALKASPGVIAFGREMNKKGFGRKRVNGLQYMTGLELKNPPKHVVERRQKRTTAVIEKSISAQKKRASQVKENVKRKIKRARDGDAVKKRMKLESKERNIAAGKADRA